MKNATMTSRQATAYSALALAATLACVGIPTAKATNAALTWKKAVDANNDKRAALAPDRFPLPSTARSRRIALAHSRAA